MQIIKYKNGNVMINAGKAGMVQGNSPLILAIVKMLEDTGENHQPAQTNKNGDTIMIFEHKIG
jgi:hypothetical protein